MLAIFKKFATSPSAATLGREGDEGMSAKWLWTSGEYMLAASRKTSSEIGR